MSLQRVMNHVLVMGDHPSGVSKAKKGACEGTAELADKWCVRAVNGSVESSIFVATISAPSLCVVLVHGMWKTENEMPFAVVDRLT